MCYNIEQKATSKQLAHTFNAKFKPNTTYQPKDFIKGFDYPLLPVLTDGKPEIFQFMHWGLIPHWAKDDQIKQYTLNARVESLEETPSFREITDQRCILPITGFFEWKWLDEKGKRKEKYRIGLKQYPIFGLAGLYSHWTDPKTGNTEKTFSLLTTEAGEVMAEINNIKKRQPVVMDVGQSKNWLETGRISMNDELETLCLENDGQLDLFS